MHDPINIAVGQLAVSHGFLTREAAFHCLNHATQRGMTFAEVARHLGVLTDSKYQKLNWLSSQMSQPQGSPSYIAAPNGPPASVLNHSAVNSQVTGGLPEPGEWIGSYQIQRLLGKGGMGAVYAARRGERDYALKMILALENPADEIRFEREAQAAAAVDRHPNVVSVHSYDRHGNTPYAVFDLIEGVGLDELLTTGEAQELDWTLNIVIKSLRALVHIHKAGVIHRDLKPANILIRHSDGEPLITDFGLAKQEDAEKLTRTGEMLGTPAYMAAEQMSGNTVTEAADVWAMGVILYELLTGYRPFPGSTLLEICNKVLLQDPISPRKHVPDLDVELETVILKCLQRDLADRYQTAQELLDDLERYQNGESIEAVLPSFDVVGASKKFWWAGVALLIAMLFLGGGAFIYLSSVGRTEIDRLEASLPEGEAIDAAIATRLVQVSQGNMGISAVDELVPISNSRKVFSQLKVEAGPKITELKSFDRLLRLNLLLDLVKLKHHKAETLRAITAEFLQEQRKASKIKGPTLNEVILFYLALNSKQALQPGDAFLHFEKLPNNIQSITLPLLDGVIAKGMVIEEGLSAGANYKRLVELHKELKNETWRLFSKTLCKELEDLRLRSQKPNARKLFGEIFPKFVALFDGEKRIDLSVFKELPELLRYQKALSKEKPLLALEAASQLKKLLFWNHVPDGALEDQLNKFFSLNPGTTFEGRSREYILLQALEVGCVVANYGYFISDLEGKEKDDKSLKRLCDKLRAANKDAWYFHVKQLAYRSKGRDETRETWIEDCYLTLARAKTRLNTFKSAVADPTISDSVRSELQGLIVQALFDMANYQAMVATLKTNPSAERPSPENFEQSFQAQLPEMGHYLRAIQQQRGAQITRISGIKKWLLQQGFDYEMMAPLLHPKVSAIFTQNSLTLGVPKLRNLLLPGVKPDVKVNLSLEEQRMLLLRLDVSRQQFKRALEQLKLAKQKMKRREPVDFAKLNEPRTYIDPFTDYLFCLKRLGLYQCYLDEYDEATKGDSEPIRVLRGLFNPKMDRIRMFWRLKRFKEAIAAMDQLIRDDLSRSRPPEFPVKVGIQVELGLIVRSLGEANQLDLAHAFFKERVGGRLDLWDQSLFKYNPFLIRKLLFNETRRKDAQAIQDYSFPLIKRSLTHHRRGVLGWNIRESYHWEVHHMLNELKQHCDRMGNFEPIAQLLLSFSKEEFEQNWPRYSHLKRQLSKAASWKALSGVIQKHELTIRQDLAFALSPGELWVQWPLHALLPVYFRYSHDNRLREALQLELSNCVGFYNKSRDKDGEERKRERENPSIKKKWRPTQQDKIIALLQVVMRSELTNITAGNGQFLNQFAYPLLRFNMRHELEWVQEKFFNLINYHNLSKNKLASPFQKVRAQFILEWYLLLLKKEGRYAEMAAYYERLTYYKKPDAEMTPAVRDFLQTFLRSKRYSTYHYGFALIKLKRMAELDPLLTELNKNESKVQYYRLLIDRRVGERNFEALLEIKNEMNRARFRHRATLFALIDGLYFVGTKQEERYKKHKAYAIRTADFRKYISEWEALIADLKDE